MYELDHPNKLVSQWGDTWNAISIKIPNLSCQLMVDNFFFFCWTQLSTHTFFSPIDMEMHKKCLVCFLKLSVAAVDVDIEWWILTYL